MDKTRLNETKTKLKSKDRSVLKITFKIIHFPPRLEKPSSPMQKDVYNTYEWEISALNIKTRLPHYTILIKTMSTVQCQ